MKIWQILTRLQKKYKNLANYKKDFEKYVNLALFDRETERV